MTRATTNLALAVIANLVIPRSKMRGTVGADPRYTKIEADNLEAFADALYSEPGGEERLTEWVRQVFPVAITFLYHDRYVEGISGCL